MPSEDSFSAAQSSVAATRCPECKKAFRVTGAQLEQARGLVRCGYCHHLFQARQHFLALAPGAPGESQPGQQPVATTPASADSRKKTTPGQASAPTPAPALAPAQSIARGSSDRAALAAQEKYGLAGLNEPLDLQYRHRRWSRTLAISLAYLLALAGLFVQYLGYNAADISRSAGWLRHPLALMCTMVSCPSFDQTPRVVLQEFVVRPGKENENQFRIDALLVNTSSKEQPYPKLYLNISDQNNALLASRVLEPEDYLSGAAAGALRMPPHQPVQIVLHMESPGPEAHYVALDFASG
ncbi:MAG: zinc-ribbon and DUF3426 domain-containing protein [Kistimonas sp.]|nr:zinc-ribbon and DUF3426 domain-containing protein [Kistimonas sp.]